MIKVATALNSFASEPEAAAQPSEEIFVLTASHLQGIITQAIEQAAAPILQEMQDLKRRMASLDERGAGSGVGKRKPQNEREGVDKLSQVVQTIQVENAALKCELEAFQEITARERAYDRQRLAKLENTKRAPRNKELSRAEKIAKYMKDRPDHKATFETLKGHLGVDNVRLNEALRVLMTLHPGRYGKARLPGDKRKRVLVMLPE
jgi:hypothetical protein